MVWWENEWRVPTRCWLMQGLVLCGGSRCVSAPESCLGPSLINVLLCQPLTFSPSNVSTVVHFLVRYLFLNCLPIQCHLWNMGDRKKEMERVRKSCGNSSLMSDILEKANGIINIRLKQLFAVVWNDELMKRCTHVHWTTNWFITLHIVEFTFRVFRFHQKTMKKRKVQRWNNGRRKRRQKRETIWLKTSGGGIFLLCSLRSRLFSSFIVHYTIAIDWLCSHPEAETVEICWANVYDL